MTEIQQIQISVIIPTLNEETTLGKTLDALGRLTNISEIIISDGGSSDATSRIAQQHKCRLVRGGPGRGLQLRCGAEAARGVVLWFLHADTIPPVGADELILGALSKPFVVGGHFRVRFSGELRSARFFERTYRILQSIGISYGDSAYFVRRDAYDAAGGFRPLPLFEDLDLKRRLRAQGRFACVRSAVTTSSRRFSGRSATAMLMLWTFLQLLYWCGVPPTRLASLYSAGSGRELLREVKIGPRGLENVTHGQRSVAIDRKSSPDEDLASFA